MPFSRVKSSWLNCKRQLPVINNSCRQFWKAAAASYNWWPPFKNVAAKSKRNRKLGNTKSARVPPLEIYQVFLGNSLKKHKSFTLENHFTFRCSVNFELCNTKSELRYRGSGVWRVLKNQKYWTYQSLLGTMMTVCSSLKISKVSTSK